MNFLGPIPSTLFTYVAVAAGALTIIAYILKMRRRRFEVPFSALWRRVLEQRDANSLWKQLKRWMSLLLALALLALLLIAALDPTLGGIPKDARSVVVLLDASASMKASDGAAADSEPAEARMEAAKRRARDLIDSMGDIIRKQIENFDKKVEVSETGTVLTAGDGIARVYGLASAQAGELLIFEGAGGEKVEGMVLNLEEDNVGVALLGRFESIREGDVVRRTGRIVEVAVGEELIGRVVNAIGVPVDGGSRARRARRRRLLCRRRRRAGGSGFRGRCGPH